MRSLRIASAKDTALSSSALVTRLANRARTPSVHQSIPIRGTKTAGTCLARRQTRTCMAMEKLSTISLRAGLGLTSCCTSSTPLRTAVCHSASRTSSRVRAGRSGESAKDKAGPSEDIGASMHSAAGINSLRNIASAPISLLMPALSPRHRTLYLSLQLLPGQPPRVRRLQSHPHLRRRLLEPHRHPRALLLLYDRLPLAVRCRFCPAALPWRLLQLHRPRRSLRNRSLLFLTCHRR